MIPISTAELAISIANGIIKLAGKLDRLLAEKVAVQGDLVLKPPVVELGTGPNRMIQELQAHLAATSESQPGPLGARRKELAALIKSAAPDPDLIREFYSLVFPGKAIKLRIDPEEDYLKFLRQALSTTDFADNDTRTAAFYVAAFSVQPGEDQRQLGYPLRIGLLVVDALAEFGADHAQMFVRNEALRSVVQSILTRFASLDLASFEQWSPLLRQALSATLNGVLDSRNAWKVRNPWLDALMDALASAREKAGANGDNYLLGLLRGEGYRLLIGEGLARASKLLAEEDSNSFKQIASDILADLAPRVIEDKSGFGSFFKDHWADLLHAGLESIEKHGPAMLRGVKQPLLKEVLLASIDALADIPGKQLVSGETLFRLGDSVLDAVAAHPELVTDGIDKPWLTEVINSVIRTASDQDLRGTFSKAGLEKIVTGAIGRLGENPDLLVRSPGIFRELVGGILTQVSKLDALSAFNIGSAAVEGGLQAVAANPGLLKTKFAGAIADFAGLVAAAVAKKSLSSLQAADIVSAAANAALRHPDLFAVKSDVAAAVLNAALSVASNNGSGLLNGSALPALIGEVMTVLARFGLNKATQLSAELSDELAKVLKAGLTQCEMELGRSIDRVMLPKVLAGLVGLWARDQLQVFDPQNAEFKRLFALVAQSAS